jgi:uncharacterized alpha-E superfamily protein
MLGKTAGGLFWMARYLERSENTTRLIDAGFRIALTRSSAARNEWASVVTTTGGEQAFLERYDEYTAANVVDFLLRDRSNPSSVMSAVEAARNNARLVRTALTREVWEATNECWITLKARLQRPIAERDLPDTLDLIRQQSSLVRGAMHGTMLRNEIYDFVRIGTFIERADNTARILDVKYYVLLPSIAQVGSQLDNVQWETILRSVSAYRSYRWLNNGEITPAGIANFLIFDRRMPRSLRFTYGKISENLKFLIEDHGAEMICGNLVDAQVANLDHRTIETLLETGLHEFLADFLRANAELAGQIERDFRFYK